MKPSNTNPVRGRIARWRLAVVTVPDDPGAEPAVRYEVGAEPEHGRDDPRSRADQRDQEGESRDLHHRVR